MANYTITNGSTAGGGTQYVSSTAYAGAVLTMGAAATPYKGKLYDLLIGTASTPADAFLEYEIARVTAVSTAGATGTLVVAPPLDSGDGAAKSVVTVNSTTFSPVAVPNLWYVGVNQRASYRWVAAPGSEIVWPATASAGITLRTRGAAGVVVTGTAMFNE